MSITKKEFMEAKTVAEKILDFLLEKNVALSTEEIGDFMGKMPVEKVLGYLMGFQEQGIVVGKEIESGKVYWIHNIPVEARKG